MLILADFLQGATYVFDRNQPHRPLFAANVRSHYIARHKTGVSCVQVPEQMSVPLSVSYKVVPSKSSSLLAAGPQVALVVVVQRVE